MIYDSLLRSFSAMMRCRVTICLSLSDKSFLKVDNSSVHADNLSSKERIKDKSEEEKREIKPNNT
jgi:hypothetical protein